MRRVARHPDHAPLPSMWAHHEKMVVVDQSAVFLGGIDLCFGRWDDHRHRYFPVWSTVRLVDLFLQIRSRLKRQLKTNTTVFYKKNNLNLLNVFCNIEPVLKFFFPFLKWNLMVINYCKYSFKYLIAKA